ncbi:MAG TPA: hypothetical protein EYP30_07650 [Archaeoglobaceae archaeon]|nr:hypothetical protein [Archaeoglobaceae archaeon]
MAEEVLKAVVEDVRILREKVEAMSDMLEELLELYTDMFYEIREDYLEKLEEIRKEKGTVFRSIDEFDECFR